MPLIVHGPGIPAGRISRAQCYLRDLYPTTCDLCDVPTPASVQGRSLRPVIEGEQPSIYEELYAHFRDSQQMVRTDEWKLVNYPLVRREQLFRLLDDPHELEELIDAPRFEEVAQALREKLKRHFLMN